MDCTDTTDDDLAPLLQESINVVTNLQAITRADRCDSDCPAAAWIRLVKGRGVLDFCRHHYTDNAAHLDAQGWMIHDTVPEPGT